MARHTNALICEVIQSNRTWVRHGSDGVEFWKERQRGSSRRFPIRAPLDRLAASQNGRWAAAPDFARHQVTVWDCGGDGTATNLPARDPDRVWFSPDSRWLIASVESGYGTWQTGSWTPGPALEARLDSGDPGEVTFSADGRLAALRQERGVFRLVSLPDFHELVTLKPPLVAPVRNACLSPDGSRLWLLGAGFRLFEWNLANLRQELVKMGLDWE